MKKYSITWKFLNTFNLLPEETVTEADENTLGMHLVSIYDIAIDGSIIVKEIYPIRIMENTRHF